MSLIRLLLRLGVGLLLWLGLSGCVPTQSIGTRPAPDVLGSIEAYLQRYQPGPTPRVFQTTRFFDRHGRLLAERWDEGRRTWVSLDRISEHLIDATIATEDASFYVNYGVDPVRIVGAALQNAQQGQVVSGASTITMQLARNLFLGPDERYDQTMDRKLLEAGLAQELTALFSKDELLEAYLNLLNYGHLAYGPEAAAQVYFGKSAADLTLAEATLLAGIPQRPADLDPLRNFAAAKARQRVVLDLMVRHGYLSPEQADAVFAEELVFNPAAAANPVAAPHFVEYVAAEVERRLGSGASRRSGLQVTTSLDLDMQHLAQRIVAARVAELRPRHDLGNAALVALKPDTGEILVMVGSADFADESIHGQVNVAVSPRQPGSAIKPVLYAAALDTGLISPATVLWDTPITYTVGSGLTYTPRNYDNRFHGPVTVRTALANSYNVPAVKLLEALTVEQMLTVARALGMNSLSADPGHYGLSLTLGGGEVTLLELTGAFAALANGGVFVPPQAILNVTDAQGRPVDWGPAPVGEPVVSPEAAFLVTDILADNAARTPAFGANSPLRLSPPAAAKTGTTTDVRDNWTVGYTRYLVAGVWAGNSDGRPMRGTSGLTGAAPIWHDFMEAVLKEPAFLTLLGAPDDPQQWAFTPPPTVERRPDCPPGLVCRQGGEYFSRAWLEAVGEKGPLADSVEQVPSAPVYVDRGEGPHWTAYCRTEPAATRTLLRLPAGLGLARTDDEEARHRERLHAIAWVLEHPTPVNLGPCDELAATVAQALALYPRRPPVTVLVDLAAALDPNAGPVPGTMAAPVAVGGADPTPVPAGFGFFPVGPVIHHHDCPGHYIVGQVRQADGAGLPGVHITLVDEWGNRADAISKSGAVDYGRYDFPINYFANRYTLVVVDEAGHPISPPVVVEHLQGEAGDFPCHTVDWVRGW